MMTPTVLGILKIKKANTFLTRLRGLLGTKFLAEDEGLLISPCQSVHTIGMRYPISLVCLDTQGCVVSTKANLIPNRCYMAPKGTYAILELSSEIKNLHLIYLGQKFFYKDNGL